MGITWGLFQLRGTQAKEQGHSECHRIEELQELELPRLWEKLRKIGMSADEIRKSVSDWIDEIK